MNAVDRYLVELEASLRIRGPQRRRLLTECHDHLTDASDAYGPDEAVRRFGAISDVVRAFEIEVAVRRARSATLLTAVAVLAIGASTLMMVNAAEKGLSAPPAWAVVFFVSAQTAAVSMVLALLRAAAVRDAIGTPAEVSLLCRRNWVALAFAGLTMFAAGAAVAGDTAAWRILLGPALAVLAGAALLRAGLVARRHRSREDRAVHEPLADLATVVRRAVPAGLTRPGVILAPVLFVSAVAAFWWSYRDDHGTAAGAAVAAGVEAAAVLAGFVLLGPALGLYERRGRTPQRS